MIDDLNAEEIPSFLRRTSPDYIPRGEPVPRDRKTRDRWKKTGASSVAQREAVQNVTERLTLDALTGLPAKAGRLGLVAASANLHPNVTRSALKRLIRPARSTVLAGAAASTRRCDHVQSRSHCRQLR